MPNPNLRDQKVRQKIIQQIMGPENQQRKAEHFRRFEIYRERQGQFIEQKLLEEFTSKTVTSMRKIKSINLTKRIVDESASIYNRAPKREFPKMSENEELQIKNLYKLGAVDSKMKIANRYYKLFDQEIVQVVPKSGVIQPIPLPMHQVDCIPQDEDPEKAFAYVIGGFDKEKYLMPELMNQQGRGDPTGPIRDSANQDIGDPDDWKSRVNRFEWWTDELNFVTNEEGVIISGGGKESINAIGELPFVDIAEEKDFEFFVRRGNGVVEFGLEFGVLLSDTATINRLQGYSQAIVYSQKQPENMVVGPNHIIWLKQDEDGKAPQPKFEFATPSPDMAASLELLEVYLRLFLSSKGIDPKTVSGKSETQRFNSGMERLLAMIEKFEASQSDLELFRYADCQVYRLMAKWSNAFQGVNENGLDDELRIASIPEDIDPQISFCPPEMIETRAERLDGIVTRLENQLMSRKEAIMKDREVDEETALKILDEIEEDQALEPEEPEVPPPGGGNGAPEDNEE